MEHPRLQRRHARRPGAVKHSPSLLQQEQTHYHEAAARDHSAAVSSLMSFSAGSSLRRVVEVGLDRRRRAAQTSGDLRDRKPLGLAKVARESNRPVAFVHTVISWRRSIGRHVSSIANVEVVPAADVAGLRTSRDSGCRDRESRRDRVSRTGRRRHVRGRSVAGRGARPPLACRPTRQAQIDELRPAIPRRAPTPLGAGL